MRAFFPLSKVRHLVSSSKVWLSRAGAVGEGEAETSTEHASWHASECAKSWMALGGSFLSSRMLEQDVSWYEGHFGVSKALRRGTARGSCKLPEGSLRTQAGRPQGLGSTLRALMSALSSGAASGKAKPQKIDRTSLEHLVGGLQFALANFCFGDSKTILWPLSLG